jgi:hypothetical protein
MQEEVEVETDLLVLLEMVVLVVEVMVLEAHQLHQMVEPTLVVEEVAEATMDPLVVELVVMEDQE